MRLLAIDTSTSWAGAAVLEDGAIVGGFGLNSGKNHSLGLLPLLDMLLQQTGLKPADMDALAATIGPGSFTGLRIGCATVQAWGLALDKPLLAVSSSAALARMLAIAPGPYICTLFDARRSEVYAALFRGGERLWPDTALAPDQLAARLRGLDAPLICGGDGLAAAAPALIALGVDFTPAAPQHNYGLAPGAAVIAAEKYARQEFTPAEELLPLYIRLSEAEEKRRLAAQTAGAAGCGPARAEDNTSPAAPGEGAQAARAENKNPAPGRPAEDGSHA